MSAQLPTFSMRERLLKAGFIALTVTASALAAAFAPQIQEGTLGGRSAAQGVGPNLSALTALRTELEQERAQRQELAAQIDQLEQRMASLAVERRRPRPRRAAADAPAGDQRDEAESEAAAARRPRLSPEERVARREERRRERREQMLAQAGLDEAGAAQLRERFEAAELERLYLRDRARRDGISPQEVRAAEQDIEDGLRNALGADYDAGLFAMGRPNRVEVRNVISGSSAAVGGLQRGDIILGFGGQPVYNPREVTRMVRDTELGQVVPVQVQRGDQVLSLRIPGGPLGASLNPTRRPPIR